MLRWSALALVLATTATTARADDARARFGLDPTPPPKKDPRDAFGLPPTAPPPKPDCADGTTFGCTGATDELDDATPYALTTYLPAAYLAGLPVGYTTNEGVAPYGLGAVRDEQGTGFAGANGLETRWTVDGAPADDARYGGADTSIPLAFLRAIRTTAGGFSARDRVSTGGAVDADLLAGTPTQVVDAHLYGSASAAPRYRAIAPGVFQVRRLYTRADPSTAATLTATGPLPHHAWYAAGLGFTLSPAQFRSETNFLVDADGDQVADHDSTGFTLDHFSTTRRTVFDYSVPLLARAGIDSADHRHHLALSLVGTYAGDHPTLALATDEAGGIDRTNYTGDAIATYRFTLPDTRIRLQLAWHRSATREAARDATAATTPQLLSAYVPAMLVEDPDLAAACVPTSMFSQCAVPLGFFASGGAGLLVDQTADRPTATADITQRISPRNIARAGFAFEDTRLVLDSRYTGGELDRSLFPGHTDHAHFHGDGNCPDMQFLGPCDYLTDSILNYRTRYTAGYIEDTFHPIPSIAVDAGVRYELMWVGTVLHFSDELAPRLGATYDFTLPQNVGTGRAFASLGRSFAYLPAGLGSTVLPGDRIVHEVEIAGIGTTRTLDNGAPDTIAPDLLPTTQDEATAGATLGIASAFHATAYVQARRLTAMETAGTELANPTDGVAPAERETRVFGAELATRGKLAFRAGYTFTTAVGNTTGMADPRQGAVLYAGSDFDNSGAPSQNQFGALPTQAGHRFFLEARRTGHLFGIPLSSALRLTASSGRPRDVLAQSGEGVVYLLPRGAGGTGPMVTQANTELAAHVAGCDITLDIFNLFDRTTATSTESVYTITAMQPISGGSPADLVFARGTAGARVQRWTPFQYGTQFQAPIAATVGIRRSF